MSQVFCREKVLPLPTTRVSNRVVKILSQGSWPSSVQQHGNSLIFESCLIRVALCMERVIETLAGGATSDYGTNLRQVEAFS